MTNTDAQNTTFYGILLEEGVMSDKLRPRESHVPTDDKDAGQRNFAQLAALGQNNHGGMPDERTSDSPLIQRTEQTPERLEHP